MKQVTAYASSQQLETLMKEFMNLGIREIKTLNNYSQASGVSHFKLLCDEMQAKQVCALLRTLATTDKGRSYSVSIQDVDQAAFVKRLI